MRFWSGYGDAQHGQRAETSPPLPGTPRKPHSMEKKSVIKGDIKNNIETLEG